MTDGALTDWVEFYTQHGSKLTPFNTSIFVYTVITLLEAVIDVHWIGSMIAKCVPTLCLMAFAKQCGTKNPSYSLKIRGGLFCSSVGDALLEIGHFPEGMAAFAIAQVFYISAFSWKKAKPIIAICLSIPSTVALYTILPNVDDLPILVGLPIYTVLLATMCWRAIARIDSSSENTIHVLQWSAALGSVLFVLSDTLIAVDRFYVDIPYRTFLIMSTYYVAQLTIATSVYRKPAPGEVTKQKD